MFQENFKHKLRYFKELFFKEFLLGTKIQKKRFVGRFLSRIISIESVSKLSWTRMKGKFYWTKLCGQPIRKNFKKSDLLWYWSTAKADNHPYLLSLVDRRYEGGPKVIVIGTGSVGDALQITPLLQALQQKLPTAEICLLHRSKSAKQVLRNNPYLHSIAYADFDTFFRMKQAVAKEGGVDLIVEIESVTYLVSYVCAPISMQHNDFIKQMPPSFFKEAADVLEQWRAISPVAMVKNRLLDERVYSWPQSYKNIHFLDLLAKTSGLLIDRFANLDFQLDPFSKRVLEVIPKKKRFITVQNGVDLDVMRWGRATGLRPTKMLPFVLWSEVVQLLRAHDFEIVQIGLEEDRLIDGIAFDLRGTTLQEAAQILKLATCHLGTEGGLVHLARAVRTRSVVLFGPTPVEFLGYPQNTNLTIGSCASCWRATKDWFIFCPKGFNESLCMHYEAQAIVQAVLKSIL